MTGTQGSIAAAAWRAQEHHTITGLLDAQSGRRPDQACLIIRDEVITYAQLRQRTLDAAANLYGLGLRAGETVAIVANTHPSWVYTLLGAARLGALAVPINTAYRGSFLSTPLRSSGCRMALVEDVLLDRMAALATDLPDLRTVIVQRTGADPLPALPWRTEDSTILTETGSPTPPNHQAQWKDPICILYTSGTTGPSKGAVISHQYIVAAASTMARSWHLAEGEVLYAPLPLFHISAVGSVVSPIVAGATGLLDPVFSVSECWNRVRRYDVKGILLAGVMVNMLWNLPEDERDAQLPLRFISAAPIPRGLHRPIEKRYGVAVLTSYGMTEAFPMVVYGLDDVAREGATGRAQPNFEVVVLDGDDEPVPTGDMGEICCRPRAPHVMFEGYFDRPETTVDRWRNLWFHTGDIGRMDAEGHVTFVDRNKDAIRRRGENISSFEVEQTLLRHPAVAEAAAVAVPSALGEDDVKVVVSLKPQVGLSVPELMDYCVEHLPYFAVPRYVEVMDRLPMNPTGKVLKTDLRDSGVTDATWDREAAGYVVRR
jgi:crotonobetaine/carnitine-CoA ligase